MSESRQSTVTGLLTRAHAGDRARFDQLFSLAYHDLSHLAAAQRPRWRRDDPLNTTALAHEESLDRLERQNRRQVRIIECRFFGGMTMPDTAEALGVSPSTVTRGWAAAQAWLYRDLRRALGTAP